MTGEMIEVRYRRTNGKWILLRVPADKLQECMNIANDHCGTSKEMIGGPELVPPAKRAPTKRRT